MPKLKTNRGAAKRFRRTGSGLVVRSKAFRRHILTSKTTKRKRGLRRTSPISSADARRVSQMLPYS